MTFSIDNPEGGCNNPPLGKYVWEKPSGEQGLSSYFDLSLVFLMCLSIVIYIYFSVAIIVIYFVLFFDM